MKATLEFNLPEDNSDFQLAVNSSKIFHVIWNLDQYLRSKIKYEDHLLTQEKFDAYEEIRRKLFEIMSENSVGFDQFE